MKIGFFTDTYFPQVSGVSTSVRTLKHELEKNGHDVYIFTTTDPNVTELEPGIIRMPSIPLASFKERRIVVSGVVYAYYAAKELELDIVHTHTEFGMGFLGKYVAKSLGIPCVHTYHTMYEDYLHYIANGKILRPYHVRQLSRFFTHRVSGIACPSQKVVDKLLEYDIDTPLSIIPTGIDIDKFKEVSPAMTKEVRERFGIADSDLLLVSVCRLSYEKNVQTIISGMPKITAALPHAKLLIVGAGPYREALEAQAASLGLTEQVIFSGEIPNEIISPVYHAADLFVSASGSETQGLMYTEAMASQTQVVAKGNDYLNELFDDRSLGVTFAEDHEFAETLIAYVADSIPLDKELLQEKLYDISSTAFGRRIESFYEDAFDYYANVIDRIEEEEIDEKRFIPLRFFKNR